MPGRRIFVLACATVIEEMLPLMPAGAGYEALDFGLHVEPASLHTALQERIDALAGPYDQIVLGYGLCSMAVAGIRARRCTLVVPRVHDCIALFLGSQGAYATQARHEPGTYYLTKGWIEAGDGPFADYERALERYGRQQADRLIKLMLGNYTRLALINTGLYELDRYREYCRNTAGRFGLRYEEIEGSTALVERMLTGPWTPDDFIVVPPGGAVKMEQFFDRPPGTS
jgi:hypothetical protein